MHWTSETGGSVAGCGNTGRSDVRLKRGIQVERRGHIRPSLIISLSTDG